MSMRKRSVIRTALLRATCIAFACRLLVPAGYMPAALGEGWPIKLCHQGLPEHLLGAHHDGHHQEHDQHDSGEQLLWEHCPFGALLGAALIVGEFSFVGPDFGVTLWFSRPAGPMLAVDRLTLQPRAPPPSLDLLA